MRSACRAKGVCGAMVSWRSRSCHTIMMDSVQIRKCPMRRARGTSPLRRFYILRTLYIPQTCLMQPQHRLLSLSPPTNVGPIAPDIPILTAPFQPDLPLPMHFSMGNSRPIYFVWESLPWPVTVCACPERRQKKCRTRPLASEMMSNAWTAPSPEWGGARNWRLDFGIDVGK